MKSFFNVINSICPNTITELTTYGLQNTSGNESFQPNTAAFDEYEYQKTNIG
jgi:hypothetical protein